MLDYNVPGGKLNRGMAVLDVLRGLKHPAVRRIGLLFAQLSDLAAVAASRLDSVFICNCA